MTIPADTTTPPETWVFHRGALGDSVLLWPLLRRLRAAGPVVLVAERHRADLAARELGVTARGIESPLFNALWSTDPAPTIDPRADRVLSFVHDDPAGTWATNARRAFPNAAIEFLRAPITRPDALAFGGPFTIPPRRGNTDGPVVMHVGAGSTAKRWPLSRCLGLAAELTPRFSVRLVAGETEHEQFQKPQHDAFTHAGGVFIDRLDHLAEIIRSARVFLGADSGPSHLAAQLGIPTLALFGPTDPASWAPIGPDVTILAPSKPAAMEWLSVGSVLRRTLALAAC